MNVWWCDPKEQKQRQKQSSPNTIKPRCLHSHFFWIISLSKQCLCRVFLWANTENDLTISCSLVKLLTCIFDTLWVSLSTSRLLLCHTSCPGVHRHKTQPANRMRNWKQSQFNINWLFCPKNNSSTWPKWGHKRHFAHVNGRHYVFQWFFVTVTHFVSQ